MFSGGDSNGDGINSLNHFAHYQMQAAATGGVNIDWATLAQQWIQMRDTIMPTAGTQDTVGNIGGYVARSATPTIPAMGSCMPIFQQNNNKQISMVKPIEEKGEADMDMDDDEEDLMNKNKTNIANVKFMGNDSPPPPPPSMQLGAGMQPHWFVNAKSQKSDVLEAVSPWNAAWQSNANLPLTASHTPPARSATINNPTAHIPSLLNLNVVNPNEVKDGRVVTSVDIQLPNSGVDAAKRKTLPAWIREGLEKMEREKLKQMEREQQLEYEKQNAGKASMWESEEEPDEENVKYSKSMVNKVNATSDDVCSAAGIEHDVDIAATNVVARTALVAANDSDASSEDDNAEHDVDDSAGTTTARAAIESGKTYEQKVNDLMFVVRRTLTELLLEVTNEEIANVANETLRARKTKASSAQVIHKSALSSITGKLGLAAYADSSSDSEDSNSTSDREYKSSNIDSEEELKMTIRTKRRAFAKIAEDIEERIADAEQREEDKLKHYTSLENNKNKSVNDQQTEKHDSNEINSNSATATNSGGGTTGSSRNTKTTTFGKGFDKDFGETTDTKLHNYNGAKRNSRKERTTRFSDNKDTKIVAAANAAAAAVTTQLLSQSNKATTAAAAVTTPTITLDPAATQQQTITNPATGLLQAANLQYANPKTVSGINSVMSAAEAALEKAAAAGKSKSRGDSSSSRAGTSSKQSKYSSSSTSRSRRRRYSSDDDDERDRVRKRRSNHKYKKDYDSDSRSSSSSDSSCTKTGSSSSESSRYNHSPAKQKHKSYKWDSADRNREYDRDRRHNSHASSSSNRQRSKYEYNSSSHSGIKKQSSTHSTNSKDRHYDEQYGSSRSHKRKERSQSSSSSSEYSDKKLRISSSALKSESSKHKSRAEISSSSHRERSRRERSRSTRSRSKSSRSSYASSSKNRSKH